MTGAQEIAYALQQLRHTRTQLQHVDELLRRAVAIATEPLDDEPEDVLQGIFDDITAARARSAIATYTLIRLTDRVQKVVRDGLRQDQWNEATASEDR